MSVTSAPATRWSTANKVGLVLSLLLNLGNIASVLFPTPDGEVGPPFGILLVDTLLGIVGVVATVVAWRRGSKVAARLAAVALILIVVTALPAFFVDVPAAVKVLTGAFTLVTVAACALMLTPNRGAAR